MPLIAIMDTSHAASNRIGALQGVQGRYLFVGVAAIAATIGIALGGSRGRRTSQARLEPSTGLSEQRLSEQRLRARSDRPRVRAAAAGCADNRGARPRRRHLALLRRATGSPVRSAHSPRGARSGCEYWCRSACCVPPPRSPAAWIAYPRHPRIRPQPGSIPHTMQVLEPAELYLCGIDGARREIPSLDNEATPRCVSGRRIAQVGLGRARCR